MQVVDEVLENLLVNCTSEKIRFYATNTFSKDIQ